MKHLIFYLIFLLHYPLYAEEQKALPTFAPEGLIELLDKGEIKKAETIYKEGIIKEGILIQLLADLSNVRLGAKKRYEKDNLIILEGNPWILDGNSLVEILDGNKAVIKIHKKTMRVVYVKGKFIQSFLLK